MADSLPRGKGKPPNPGARKKPKLVDRLINALKE